MADTPPPDTNAQIARREPNGIELRIAARRAALAAQGKLDVGSGMRSNGLSKVERRAARAAREAQRQEAKRAQAEATRAAIKERKLAKKQAKAAAKEARIAARWEAKQKPETTQEERRAIRDERRAISKARRANIIRISKAKAAAARSTIPTELPRPSATAQPTTVPQPEPVAAMPKVGELFKVGDHFYRVGAENEALLRGPFPETEPSGPIPKPSAVASLKPVALEAIPNVTPEEFVKTWTENGGKGGFKITANPIMQAGMLAMVGVEALIKAKADAKLDNAVNSLTQSLPQNVADIKHLNLSPQATTDLGKLLAERDGLAAQRGLAYTGAGANQKAVEPGFFKGPEAKKYDAMEADFREKAGRYIGNHPEASTALVDKNFVGTSGKKAQALEDIASYPRATTPAPGVAPVATNQSSGNVSATTSLPTNQSGQTSQQVADLEPGFRPAVGVTRGSRPSLRSERLPELEENAPKPNGVTGKPDEAKPLADASKPANLAQGSTVTAASPSPQKPPAPV